MSDYFGRLHSSSCFACSPSPLSLCSSKPPYYDYYDYYYSHWRKEICICEKKKKPDFFFSSLSHTHTLEANISMKQSLEAYLFIA